jgi:hypothetical protein
VSTIVFDLRGDVGLKLIELSIVRQVLRSVLRVLAMFETIWTEIGGDNRD